MPGWKERKEAKEEVKEEENPKEEAEKPKGRFRGKGKESDKAVTEIKETVTVVTKEEVKVNEQN